MATLRGPRIKLRHFRNHEACLQTNDRLQSDYSDWLNELRPISLQQKLFRGKFQNLRDWNSLLYLALAL